MEKKEFYYDSRDGLTKIHAVEWLPGGRPVCILQIVHGMAEYIDRYHRMAVFLAEKGILVVGNDHLGHGKSIYNKGDEKHTGSSHPYGYFCSQDPATTAVKDVLRSPAHSSLPCKAAANSAPSEAPNCSSVSSAPHCAA